MIGQPTGSGYFSRTTPSGSHLIAHRSTCRFGSFRFLESVESGKWKGKKHRRRVCAKALGTLVTSIIARTWSIAGCQQEGKWCFGLPSGEAKGEGFWSTCKGFCVMMYSHMLIGDLLVLTPLHTSQIALLHYSQRHLWLSKSDQYDLLSPAQAIAARMLGVRLTKKLWSSSRWEVTEWAYCLLMSEFFFPLASWTEGPYIENSSIGLSHCSSWLHVQFPWITCKQALDWFNR